MKFLVLALSAASGIRLTGGFDAAAAAVAKDGRACKHAHGKWDGTKCSDPNAGAAPVAAADESDDEDLTRKEKCEQNGGEWAADANGKWGCQEGGKFVKKYSGRTKRFNDKLASGEYNYGEHIPVADVSIPSMIPAEVKPIDAE